MVKYANKKRVRGLILKKEDKIYLLRRNIKIIQPSNKLDHTKIRLFKIKKIKRLINYELKLSPRIRIYLIFYISLLEPAHKKTLI